MDTNPMVFNAPALYAGWGQYLERLEQFEKSVRQYDESTKWEGGNGSILTARSRVMRKATLYEDAIRDANKALAIDEQNLTAFFMKSDGLYCLGEFEKSLVLFYTGAKLRKKPPHFIEGIGQALETIEECVGRGSGNVMMKFLPLIRRIEKENRSRAQSSEKKLKTARRGDVEQGKLSKEERHKMELKVRYMAHKYLGRMSEDMVFLKDLQQDTRLVSANKDHNTELASIARRAHRQIAVDQLSTLRTRRPVYAIEFAGATAKAKTCNKVSAELRIKQRIHSLAVKRLIDKCIEARNTKNIQLCYDYIERAKRYISSKSITELPPKNTLLSRIYEVLGQILLSQKRLNKKMSEEDNEKRVNFLFGCPISRRGSNDSVLKFYPTSYKHKTDYFRQMENQLDDATLIMEKLYCYHELSATLCDQQKHNLSMFYAAKLVQSARASGCIVWELNGMLLNIRNNVMQHNKNEVRITINDALMASKRLKNNGKLVSFLMKAMKMNDSSPDELVDNDEDKRLQAIVDLMIDHDLKEEIEFLVRKMSTMPTNRRFGVIPGKRVLAQPTTAAGRRMTISPATKDTQKKVLHTSRMIGQPNI